MAAIAPQAMQIIPNYEARDLANTSWAFATMSVHHVPLFDAIAQAAIPPLSGGDPQAISNTAWSFATLRIAHEPLM